MSSAAKTLELLSLFSPSRPEIGLSELCRLAKRDKATTYRHLQILEEAGFLEHVTAKKRYRLGPALLHLAQMRELTVPRKSSAAKALAHLAEITGETCHASVLSGTTLHALTSCESTMHSTRVIMDIQTFPLHATATGLCALAFGPKGLFDAALANLNAFTPTTAVTTDTLSDAVETAKQLGFGRSEGGFETGVNSLAAPLFDQTHALAGCVSVACVATRFTPDQEAKILINLTHASRDISRNWGGAIPESIEIIWAETLCRWQEMETTS